MLKGEGWGWLVLGVGRVRGEGGGLGRWVCEHGVVRMGLWERSEVSLGRSMEFVFQ